MLKTTVKLLIMSLHRFYTRKFPHTNTTDDDDGFKKIIKIIN